MSAEPAPALFLHDWDDESCLRILRTCRRLMPASARLVVIEALMAVPGADQATRRAAALMDLSMKSLTLTWRQAA